MISIQKLQNAYRNLPDKKRYIEFISAILTIPVLITVIVLNLNSLSASDENKSSNEKTTPSKESSDTLVKIESPKPQISSNETNDKATNSAKECIQEVGPIEISFPQEDQVISNNPLPITISRKSDEYCEVVWSYRINNSSWSDYTDNSLYLYNLTSGEKRLDLRVKSVFGDEITLTRTFTYEGSEDNSLSPTPESTSSATTN